MTTSQAPSREIVEQLSSEFLAYARTMHITLSQEDVELCVRHLLLVLEKNQVVNLTSIRDVHQGLILHILDSLTLLSLVLRAPAGQALDIGTGGGFPGIPLCIASHRTFTLLDSVGKKVSAVESFIHKLDLGDRCSAVHDRVETHALTYKDSYSCVVARAVSSLPVLIEYATPLLSMDGELLLSKGRLEDDELSRGSEAASLCGLELVSLDTIELPNDCGHRSLLVYRKVGESHIKLPRKAGIAKKRPLGSK